MSYEYDEDAYDGGYNEAEEEEESGAGYGALPPPPNRPPGGLGAGPPSVWEKQYDDESGEYYWYNRLTGESTWEEPEELVGSSAPRSGPPDRLPASFSSMSLKSPSAPVKSSVQQAEVAVDLPQYASNDFRAWEIMAYCNQQLKSVPKSLFTKPRTVAEQMKWSKELKHPLHHGRFPEKSLASVALQMFKDIAYFCGDRKGKYGPGALIYCQNAVKKALTHPMLADEFFLQLIKQTRNNPDSGDQASAGVADQVKRTPGESSVVYLYQMFALACGCMTPSDGLFKYLDVFLARSESSLAGIPADSQKMARFAREQLVRSREAGSFRVLPPNRREHQAVLRRHPVFLRVNLLNQTHITTKVYCQTSIRDLVQQISSKMAVELPTFEEWPCFGLFQQAYDKTKFISENSLQEEVRVNDILAVQDDATKNNPDSPMRFEMVFKAKLFLSHMWDSLDANAITLYYIQAVYDITNDLMPLAEPQAMQVAALQMHCLYPGALPPAAELADRVNDWLPSKFRVKTRSTKKRALALQQLVDQIKATRDREGYTEQKLGGPLEAKRALLGLLHRGVAMYGCTTFLCVHVADVQADDWDYEANSLKKLNKNEIAAMRARHEADLGGAGSSQALEDPFRRNKVPSSKTLLVGVNEKGIAWFDRKTRELRRFDKMQWIHTQGASDSHFVYVVTNRMYGDRGKRTQVFQTKHAAKILSLVRVYKRVPGFQLELEQAPVQIADPVHTYDYGYANNNAAAAENKDTGYAAATAGAADYSSGAYGGGHNDTYADYNEEEEQQEEDEYGGDYDYGAYQDGGGYEEEEEDYE